MKQYLIKGKASISFEWPPYYARTEEQAISYALKHLHDADITPSHIEITEINKFDDMLALQDEGWYNSAQEEDLKQYTL